MENLSRVIQKQTKKHRKWLSLITQFKIEFLLPFTSCGKVFGKMPEQSVESNWIEKFKAIASLPILNSYFSLKKIYFIENPVNVDMEI